MYYVLLLIGDYNVQDSGPVPRFLSDRYCQEAKKKKGLLNVRLTWMNEYLSPLDVTEINLISWTLNNHEKKISIEIFLKS